MSVQDIFKAVVEFDADKVKELVRQEIKAGTPVEDILNKGLIAPMDEVGEQFSKGDLFVPEMLMAAKSMQGGLEIIKPLLAAADSKGRGTVLIGTVKGDLHDIGKNLVAMMVEGGGFTVVDLGVDVDADTFLSKVKEHGANAVALSALLTTTMPAMATITKKIKEQHADVSVIIGGAPVTQEFADEIGAHGYAEDAPGAVELLRRLAA
jgi:5-methyltetrahydrofolate--homocysteine methyltransferase